MLPAELIRMKRDGYPLDPGQIVELVTAYTDGRVPDYQMSALAMAVFFRGLSADELAAWTRAMIGSGEVLDLSDLPGRKVDKHSTGGVGDKVSLSLAPLVAACGVKVPMISGRGLGHTGGTLDKLESIPGFRVDLDVPAFRRVVRDVGAGLIGQTDELVPADKKLYALRDVTGTIESIPLIASSIMSKKIAEGIDALVLDVKVGSGAFMKRREDALELARTMVGIGASFGKKVVALLTDMDQPLGRAVGNALEVMESVAVLQGGGPPDVRELTLALGAEMLVLGAAAGSLEEARQKLEEAIESGAGLHKFEEICRAQGGDAAALTDWKRLPAAKSRVAVVAPRAGFVCRIQTDEVGRAAMHLGAGRRTVDSVIDPAVGLVLEKRVGDAVERGEVLATLHVDDPRPVPEAEARLLAAFTFGDEPPAPRPLLVDRVARS